MSGKEGGGGEGGGGRLDFFAVILPLGFGASDMGRFLIRFTVWGESCLYLSLS